MAEASDENAGPTAAKQPRMQIVAQYIRDLSFENVLVQKGQGGDLQPEVQVAVALDARKRSIEGQYEVIQKYKVTSKAKGTNDTLYLLELEYGGIFSIENVADDQMHPFLLIECPRMLFPFVRRIVADVTRDGGFPALNMDNVDFLQLYRQEIQRRAQGQTANTTPA